MVDTVFFIIYFLFNKHMFNHSKHGINHNCLVITASRPEAGMFTATGHGVARYGGQMALCHLSVSFDCRVWGTQTFAPPAGAQPPLTNMQQLHWCEWMVNKGVMDG